MARTTCVLSVSLPPDLAKTFERMAKSKRRGKSGLFREMLEVYRRTQWFDRYQDLQLYGARKARDVRAFSEDEIDKLVLGGR